MYKQKTFAFSIVTREYFVKKYWYLLVVYVLLTVGVIANFAISAINSKEFIVPFKWFLFSICVIALFKFVAQRYVIQTCCFKAKARIQKEKDSDDIMLVYQDHQSRKHVVESQSLPFHREGLEHNDEVDILYDKKNPEFAFLYTIFSLHLIEITELSMFLPVCIITFVML